MGISTVPNFRPDSDCKFILVFRSVKHLSYAIQHIIHSLIQKVYLILDSNRLKKHSHLLVLHILIYCSCEGPVRGPNMCRTHKPLFWWATHPVNSMDCMTEGRYCLKHIIVDIFILYFKKIFPLIHRIHSVYGTCGLPKQWLVHSAHDCETGLYCKMVAEFKHLFKLCKYCKLGRLAFIRTGKM